MRGGSLVVAALIAGVATPVLAQASQGNWDGLVEVNARRLDAVFLAPGADFRTYTKIMLDPPEVAFRKDWQRNMNSGAGSRRVSDADAASIAAAAKANFSDVFSAAFERGGYTMATSPGADVMRVSTAIINVYINAPDALSSGRSRTFTANAGEATLVLEVRDAATNALLGRAIDRRETQGTPGPSSSIQNASEFRALAKAWASTSLKGLEALKALSPIPDALSPGQKLD